MRSNCTKKMLRRAGRVTVALMLLLLTHASVYAAAPRMVKLSMNGVTLEKLFEELEKQTGVKFLYNAELVKNKGQINVSTERASLERVLDQVLKPRGLDYSFIGNQVVIRRAANAVDEPAKPKVYRISGQVQDRSGAGLPGATVMVDGTSVGTTAEAKGVFVLNSPQAKGVLSVSFIGYNSVRVNFSEDKSIMVKMDENVSEVEEVTVVGYGVRKKREVVGSISSIKSEDIKDIPAPSLEALLQGRMAGVGVSQQSGAPGGGSTSMAIRGYNSLLDDGAGYKSSGGPLYVIDGVPVHSFTSPVTGTNTISEIDPSTIESVDVLKDAASAAIYGSRAANGVILITTKKGRDGRAQFSANVSYSISELPEAPAQMGGKIERDHLINMMQSTRTAYYDNSTGMWKYPTSYKEAALHGVDYDLFWQKGAGMASGNNMAPVQDSLNSFYNNSTNWYKYMFRPGQVVNANIQASGGNATMNYLIGGGVFREKGIMPGSDFIRANVISNVSVKPTKNLTLDTRIYVAYTDRSRGSGGNDGGSYEELTVDPQYASTLMPAGGIVEKRLLSMINGQSEINTSYRFRGNMMLSYEIIKGLNISTSASVDFNQMNQNFFRPSYLEPTYKESKSSGQVSRDMLLSNENLATYNFSAGNHNFDLLAGLSFDANKMWSIGGHGLGGPSDYIHYVTNAFPEMEYDPVSDYYRSMMKYNSDFSETAMTSYFGRVAYNFDQKYMLEATIRRDGSSVFGPEVRWATFPSVAAGWAFSKEDFMRWAWWLDFGKVRASWGSTGSQFSIPYLAQGLMEPGYLFDGVQGMRPSGVVNRKLKWEQSDQYDVGLDLDMFDYRLTLSLDYYYKYTKSLIFRVPMPGDMYGEGGMQWQNAMEVSNDGFELEAKYDVFRETAVKWRTRLNISHNRNKFQKSYSGTDIANSMVIGKGLSGIYLFKDNGYIQTDEDIPYYYDEDGKKHLLSPDGDDSHFYTPGMRLIEDLDGDGQITESDMFYAGSALPRAYGGWANELRWKDFDLTIFFTFTLGRDMVNAFKHSTVEGRNDASPIFSHFNPGDFWQKPGDNPKFPAYGNYSYSSQQYSGRISSGIERVHYCKLKQLTLGYNIPDKLMRKLRLSSVRAFITGENLWTITNYSGLDPEVVSVHSGIDTGAAYPLARKWTLGLTVNF